MKKTMIITSLLLAALIGRAQNDPHHPSKEEHMKKAHEMLQKELQLNASQEQQFHQALKEFGEQAEKLHKQFPPPPPPPPDPKLKEGMDKLVQERNEKLKKVLTEDQYKKFLEVEKKMHPPHPPGPMDHGHGHDIKS